MTQNSLIDFKWTQMTLNDPEVALMTLNDPTAVIFSLKMTPNDLEKTKKWIKIDGLELPFRLGKTFRFEQRAIKCHQNRFSNILNQKLKFLAVYDFSITLWLYYVMDKFSKFQHFYEWFKIRLTGFEAKFCFNKFLKIYSIIT